MTLSIRELDEQQLEALIGERDGATGFEYAERGRQPYYRWLMNSLRLIAEASLGDFRVLVADKQTPVITVLPGRATISGHVVEHGGSEMELSSYNNSVVFVWVRVVGGEAVVEVGVSHWGWPAQVHLKLAEVEVTAGEVVAVLDRRKEVVFSV